mgnify:CR=1 FL=1|tara:strand:+ start:132 stop:407 length:276 start_codon:yes stop_codon:yes gene_type:complete
MMNQDLTIQDHINELVRLANLAAETNRSIGDLLTQGRSTQLTWAKRTRDRYEKSAQQVYDNHVKPMIETGRLGTDRLAEMKQVAQEVYDAS